MQVILFDGVKRKRTSEINSFRLKSVHVWKAKRQARERDICFKYSSNYNKMARKKNTEKVPLLKVR